MGLAKMFVWFFRKMLQNTRKNILANPVLVTIMILMNALSRLLDNYYNYYTQVQCQTPYIYS